MLSILGLILSLILIIYLAYKGYSTIITAPIVAIITIILTTGFNGHLMANYTEVYMVWICKLYKKLFPTIYNRSNICKTYGRSPLC